MEITFNTKIVDIAVALNALKLYRTKNYKDAISYLVEILDVEPRNWDARLMLSACYYKTKQYAAAQRAFRFLYDNCPEEDVRSRAREGLQATNALLEKKVELPAEFGSYVARTHAHQGSTWLD